MTLEQHRYHKPDDELHFAFAYDIRHFALIFLTVIS